MENKTIQQKAYKVVVDYEKRRGRIATKAEKGAGYDIISKGKKEIRHIEVKGTSKVTPNFRFLTEKEFKTLTHDPRYFLCLVCNIGRRPKLKEFKRNEILRRFQRIQANYVIGFKPSDFM